MLARPRLCSSPGCAVGMLDSHPNRGARWVCILNVHDPAVHPCAGRPTPAQTARVSSEAACFAGEARRMQAQQSAPPPSS